MRVPSRSKKPICLHVSAKPVLNPTEPRQDPRSARGGRYTLQRTPHTWPHATIATPVSASIPIKPGSRVMNRDWNIKIFGIIVIGIVAIISIQGCFSRSSTPALLRDAIGRAFDRPVRFIELNLPPADGRYPGAVLVMPERGQTLPLRRSYRPTDIPNSATKLQIKT